MPSPTDLRKDFENVMDANGTFATFTKRLVTYSGLFEEAMFQAGSNTVTSGLALFQPIGPQDIQMLPQGQVSLYPNKMFVHGSIDIDSTTVITSTGSEYGLIPDMGIEDWVVSGVVVYRKCFVRALVGSEFEYA